MIAGARISLYARVDSRAGLGPGSRDKELGVAESNIPRFLLSSLIVSLFCMMAPLGVKSYSDLLEAIEPHKRFLQWVAIMGWSRAKKSLGPFQIGWIYH